MLRHEDQFVTPMLPIKQKPKACCDSGHNLFITGIIPSNDGGKIYVIFDTVSLCQ